MRNTKLSELLYAWREAEARLDHTSVEDPEHDAVGRAVVSAWAAYNREAGTLADDEIVLVTDGSMTYVAVFGPTERVLGWPSDELVGRAIADVTPPESMALMEASWAEFLMRGWLEGSYPLLARDRRVVMTRFRARAHHPIPGYHTSRLWALGEHDATQHPIGDPTVTA